MIHIFVYGSLKRGFRNHHFLAASRFIGTGTTRCCFDLLDLGYFPAAIKPGMFAIQGELFSVDWHTLKNLDRLEGNRGLPTAYLDGGWKALGLLRFLPAFLHDPLYRFVARSRYRWFDWHTKVIVGVPYELPDPPGMKHTAIARLAAEDAQQRVKKLYESGGKL